MRLFSITCLVLILDTSAAVAGSPPYSHATDKYNYRINGGIQGHCTVLSSIENPLPSQCQDVTLVLNASAGGEPQTVHTDNQGNFKFTARNGAKYTIRSGTENYRVTSPKGPIHGGDMLDLKVESGP